MKPAEELLATNIEIDSPKIFFAVIEDLKDFIKRGLLEEINGNCSINDICKGEPWPNDYIEIIFQTKPGLTRYELTCETYHGSGGSFKKISESEK